MEEKKKYPFIPLKDVVIFPEVTMYLEIARDTSKQALLEAMERDKLIVTSAQKESSSESPGMEDIFVEGTLSEIRQVIKARGQAVRVVVAGLKRVDIEYLETTSNNYVEATVTLVEEPEEEKPDAIEAIAMLRGIKDIFQVYANLNKKMNQRTVENILALNNLDRLINEIAANSTFNYVMKQKIFRHKSIVGRYQEVCLVLDEEINIMRIQEDIARQVKTQVEDNQKEYYLREEIKAINKELGQEDVTSEADRYAKKAEKLKAPKKVKRKLKEEINRFRKISSSSSESGVIRGYIETLLTFPWKKGSKECLDLGQAEKVLAINHYGLEKVKERMVEFLAVRALKSDGGSPIICLVGPPGTGKTSIAKSVAEALNRKYVRICLGGVRDEAEIRGHRRTYVGAMPGRIAMGLKNVGVNNPLMLLDEIDKLGSDYKGDPSSALLEVLDPEQNKHFSDHYIELPIDLSKVFFICTANSTDTIPRPLLDRMEIITLSGYTENEKFHIAKEHLLPKQCKEHGLTSAKFHVSDKVLLQIIRCYTREAGVRGLERTIAKLCRKGAKEIAMAQAAVRDMEDEGQKVSDSVKENAVKGSMDAEGQKNGAKGNTGSAKEGKQSRKGGTDSIVVRISGRNYKKYLGKEMTRLNPANENPEIGVVRGLAWTNAGGDTLEIEVVGMKGSGKLELTGQLGDVMQESAKLAYSYVRSVTTENLEEEFYEKKDFHLHVPEGATPKDGPSAGVTMATALYSAVTSQSVRPDIAMTGELSLRGRVLPVGGLKEKLLAAKAAGISEIFVPWENRRDIEELEGEVLENVRLHYVKRVEEIWKEVMV